jgi:hypothetical protein
MWLELRIVSPTKFCFDAIAIGRRRKCRKCDEETVWAESGEFAEMERSAITVSIALLEWSARYPLKEPSHRLNFLLTLERFSDCF